MFKDMEMTKQKEIIQTYKIFGRCYEKVCKLINELDRYSRWGVKMLTTLSKEMTNGKLGSKSIQHFFFIAFMILNNTRKRTNFPKTFFFSRLVTRLKHAWFELSRVKLYGNNLEGNKNYFELAGGSSYRGMLLKLVTGSGEQGTGKRERKSGNEQSAVNSTKIQNGR